MTGAAQVSGKERTPQPVDPPAGPARSWAWFLPVAGIVLTAAASEWGGVLATVEGAVVAAFGAVVAFVLSDLAPGSRLHRGLVLVGSAALAGGLLITLALPAVRLAIQPGPRTQGSPGDGTRLRQGDVSERQLRAEGLQGVVLDGLVLRSLALQGLQAQGASFKGTDLRFADLRGADLRGTRMQGADLRGAVMRGTCLAGAQLDQAQLAGADFTGADRSGATYPPDARTTTIGWATATRTSGACR